jgi:hypothetical protein
MNKLSILLIGALIGCSDPVNKALSEFKKSDISKELNECGGLSAKYSYNITNFHKLNLVEEPDSPSKDEPVLVVEITKEIVKNKPIHLNYIIRFNNQSYIFEKYSYYFPKKNDLIWNKNGLANYNYKYQDFCNNKIPGDKVTNQIDSAVRNNIDLTTYIARIVTLFLGENIENIISYLNADGWQKKDEYRNHPILGDNLPHAIFSNNSANWKIIVIYSNDGNILAINVE